MSCVHPHIGAVRLVSLDKGRLAVDVRVDDAYADADAAPQWRRVICVFNTQAQCVSCIAETSRDSLLKRHKIVE